MIQNNDIMKICGRYGIEVTQISDRIDSSKGEEDLRYNYIINGKYVLKMNTNGTLSEEVLQQIDLLQERYRSIEVWCPRFYLSCKGSFLELFQDGEHTFQCYIEEYAPYRISRDNVELYSFKKQMLGHVGKLAAKYTNIGLVEQRSMWTIIDLAPLDEDIDEKQENLDSLLDLLKEKGWNEEVKLLDKTNIECRNIIRQNFDKLPRCVYQGDLNPSNTLIDEKGDFVGIIDYNLFGTEVNINCFLNECMYYWEENDFETLTANELVSKMHTIQNSLLDSILKYYTLNEVELKCFKAYKVIIDISFYPHVELMKYYIENGEHLDKVKEIITLLCQM